MAAQSTSRDAEEVHRERDCEECDEPQEVGEVTGRCRRPHDVVLRAWGRTLIRPKRKTKTGRLFGVCVRFSIDHMNCNSKATCTGSPLLWRAPVLDAVRSQRIRFSGRAHVECCRKLNSRRGTMDVLPRRAYRADGGPELPASLPWRSPESSVVAGRAVEIRVPCF